MTLFSHLPTIFHITHPKAGSHWIYQVLAASALPRIVEPLFPRSRHFTAQPILPGMIYPAVYLTRDEFETVSVPEAHLKFVVIRDLRDTLISAYFSFRYSHVPLYIPAEHYRRVQLNSRSLVDGLRHTMHLFLPLIARIQTSWIKANVLVIRYEELLQDEYGQFERLLEHCQIKLPVEQLHQIVLTCSFQQLSGRPKGAEDIMSHYRKGVAGRVPIPEIPEMVITETLLTSLDSRMVLALLDQRYELDRAYKRQEEDRKRAFEQFKRALTPLPPLALQSDLITTGQGWHQAETYQEETFCWIANDAELIIHAPTGQHTRLSLEVEPGPGLNGQPLRLQLLDETGQIVATAAEAIGRQTVEMSLPIVAGDQVVFRLHLEGGGYPTPHDPRILNFRIFRFGWVGLPSTGTEVNTSPSEQNLPESLDPATLRRHGPGIIARALRFLSK